MTQEEKDIKLYNEAFNYLVGLKDRNKKGSVIDKEDIVSHLEPKLKKPEDFKIIYERLCETGQNHSMFSNVIGGSIGGFENLEGVLCGFNPYDVLEEYKGDEVKNFLQKVKITFNKDDSIMEEGSIWTRYAKTVFDVAHFITLYNHPSDFYKMANSLTENPKTAISLPLYIASQIRGIGFTLACDFIKELGFVNFGKPDVHIKEIFKALGFIEKSGNDMRENLDSINVLSRIADTVRKTSGQDKVTPYAVDKVLWLIGSGNFYKTQQRTGNNRNRFVEYMQKKFPEFNSGKK